METQEVSTNELLARYIEIEKDMRELLVLERDITYFEATWGASPKCPQEVREENDRHKRRYAQLSLNIFGDIRRDRRVV